ncbi:hypothetical protein [Promineifilum sp.]|uniref:hypothetical protein n=1 Tax=Promineifilum sp. TaxID=2664178 RepID=UPI0035B0FF22
MHLRYNAPIMVTYRIRRLHAPGEHSRRYHLYDRSDQLLLVADQGSGWLPQAGPPQVHFARPDGERVASMDLPRAGDRRPEKQQSYALIYEHAVYALITAPIRPSTGGTAPLSLPPPSGSGIVWPFTRLLIEVEGNRWLGLCWSEADGPLLVLYDAPDGLPLAVDPDPADLPDAIGSVERGAGDYHYDLTLPTGRLVQGALLGLGVVVLVDSAS